MPTVPMDQPASNLPSLPPVGNPIETAVSAIRFDPTEMVNPEPLPQSIPDMTDAIVPRASSSAAAEAIARMNKRSQSDRLMASVSSASRTDPNTAAEANKLGSQIGIDATTAIRNLQEVRKRVLLDDIYSRDLPTKSPKLAESLSDPDFAAVAHDDVNNLSAMESVFDSIGRNWSNTVNSITEGILQTQQAYLEEEWLRSGRGGNINPLLKNEIQQYRLAIEALNVEPGPLTPAGTVAGQMFETLFNVAPYGVAGGAAGAIYGGTIGTIGGAMLPGANVVTTPAGALAGWFYGAGVGMRVGFAAETAKQESAGAYVSAMRETARNKAFKQWQETHSTEQKWDGKFDEFAGDHAASAPVAYVVGGINGLIETTLLGAVSGSVRSIIAKTIKQEVAEAMRRKMMKPGFYHAIKEFAKKMGKETSANVIEEVSQQMTSIVGDQMAMRMSDPDAVARLDTAEGRAAAIDEIIDIAIQTAQGMIVVGAPAPAIDLYLDHKATRNMRREQKSLTSLIGTAENSELRKRSPGTLEAFLAKTARNTDASTIYVRADAFREALQETGTPLAEVEKVIPGITEQLRLATTVDDNVQISTAAYAAHIVGLDLNTALRPHLRLSEGALSLSENNAAAAKQKDFVETATKLLEEKNGKDDAFIKSTEVVRERIAKQLEDIGTYSADEAKVMAEMALAWYVTTANQFGMTPEQVHDARPNIIRAEQTAEQRAAEPAKAQAPDTGTFDSTNPPVSDKPIFAVMNADGKIYYDVNATMHGDLVETFPDIADTTVDGGFIIDGEYKMGMSDGGYSALDGTDEQIEQVKNFTERANAGKPKTYSQRMSTRIPKAVKSVENALTTILLADYKAFTTDPEFVAKNLDMFKKLGAPIRVDESLSQAEQLEQIISHMSSNLLYVHDQMDPAWRDRARKWYEGGRVLVDWMAKRHNITPMQAAALYAVLSPQKNWYENVNLGNRIADIAATQRNATMTPEMIANYLGQEVQELNERLVKATERLNKAGLDVVELIATEAELLATPLEPPVAVEGQTAKEYKAAVNKYEVLVRKVGRQKESVKKKIVNATEKLAKVQAEYTKFEQVIAGKKLEAQAEYDAAVKTVAKIGSQTLGELLDSKQFAYAAILVRQFDETVHTDRSYATVTPEGGIGAPEKTGSGANATVRYGSYGMVAKALSVFTDGSLENIHAQIGNEHKVRNFYNNLFDPQDQRFATIDTHAIAAAYLMPLAGEDALVMHGLGSSPTNAMVGLGGAYAVIFEAYRRAAVERKIQPREMQSITWEAIRGMFESAKKDALKDPVAAVWKQYVDKKISLDDARAQVMALSGGITQPSWVALPTTMTPSAGYTGVAQVAADQLKHNVPVKPQTTSMNFEVAPNPADKKAMERWALLTPAERTEVSMKVANEIIPQILKHYGIEAEIVPQVGGWEKTTSASFALLLPPSARVKQIAQEIIVALSQDSVYTISQYPFGNKADPSTMGEEGGAINIRLAPGTTPEQIDDLWLKHLEPMGIIGHSTTETNMVMGFPKGVNVLELARTINAAIGNDPRVVDVTHGKAWTDYAQRNESTGLGRDNERGRVDVLRQQAEAVIDKYVADKRAERDAAAPKRSRSPAALTATSIDQIPLDGLKPMEQARKALDAKFGESVIGKLIELGNAGKRGGLVIVSNVNDLIEKFKEKTGRELDDETLDSVKADKLKADGTARAWVIFAEAKKIVDFGKVKSLEIAKFLAQEHYNKLLSEPPKFDAKAYMDSIRGEQLDALPEAIRDVVERWQGGDEDAGAVALFKRVTDMRNDNIQMFRVYMERDNVDMGLDIFWRDYVMSYVMSAFRPDYPNTGQAFNSQALSLVYAEVAQGKAPNFDKVYEKALLEVTKRLLVLGDASNGWRKIPMTAETDPTFDRAVADMQSISHREWCTRTFNANPYVQQGDFFVYIKNDKPLLAIRVAYDNSQVYEIQGPKNNREIPPEHVHHVNEILATNLIKAPLAPRVERELKEANAAAKQLIDRMMKLGGAKDITRNWGETNARGDYEVGANMEWLEGIEPRRGFQAYQFPDGTIKVAGDFVLRGNSPNLVEVLKSDDMASESSMVHNNPLFDAPRLVKITGRVTCSKNASLSALQEIVGVANLGDYDETRLGVLPQGSFPNLTKITGQAVLYNGSTYPNLRTVTEKADLYRTNAPMLSEVTNLVLRESTAPLITEVNEIELEDSIAPSIVVVSGDAVLRGKSALDNVNRIVGDLQLSRESTMLKLERVVGDFSDDNTAYDTFEIDTRVPLLREVLGRFETEGNREYPRLNRVGRLKLVRDSKLVFPELTTVDLDVDCGRAVDAPKLANVGRSVTVHNAGVGIGENDFSIMFPSLTKVKGMVVLEGMTSLPNVTVVGDNISLERRSSLPKLIRAKSDIFIEDGSTVPMLAHVHGQATGIWASYPSLIYAGQRVKLQDADAPMLKWCGSFEGVRAQAPLLVGSERVVIQQTQLPSLQYVNVNYQASKNSFAPNLEYVGGDFSVGYDQRVANDSVGEVTEVRDYSKLERVGGEVDIHRVRLSALRSVNGDFTSIGYTPLLRDVGGAIELGMLNKETFADRAPLLEGTFGFETTGFDASRLDLYYLEQGISGAKITANQKQEIADSRKRMEDDWAKSRNLYQDHARAQHDIEITAKNKRARKSESTDATQGLFDPITGLMFLVASEVTSRTAPAVLAHEVMHGVATEEMEKSALAIVMDRASMEHSEELTAFLERVYNRMESAGVVGDRSEAIGYMVEEALIAGRQEGFSVIDDTFFAKIVDMFGKTVGEIVRKVIAHVRARMADKGAALSLTVDDMVALAENGMHKLANGEIEASGNEQATTFRSSTYSQAAVGGDRGRFDPKTLTTTLTRNANLSTFLHETGHFWLESMEFAATHPSATDQQKADFQSVLDWFGVKDAAAWNALTHEQKREYHEAWSANVEIYFAEGKAPSVALEGVFAKYATWLKKLYTNIRDNLNAEYYAEFGKDLPMLTGEIRQVMDRLLATDAQIEHAEAVRNMKPMFQSQEQSGMNDAEWAAYQHMAEESRMAAITDLNKQSMRQMQWLSNARLRVLANMQKEHDALRKEVRDEEREKIRVERTYRAMNYLKTGVFIDEDGSEVTMEGKHRIDIDAVKKMYELEPAALRPDFSVFTRGKYRMIGKDGVHPDMLADVFGFDSGDQMLRAVMAAKPFKEEVDARTDARMLSEYGDMNTPAAQQAAIEKALHNEARSRFVAVELRFLAKATQPVRVMIDAARKVARQTIGAKVIRDVRPGDYADAEARAGRAAEEATKAIAFGKKTPDEIEKAAYDRALKANIASGMDEMDADTAATKVGQEERKKAQARLDEHNTKYKGESPLMVAIEQKQRQLLNNQLAEEALDVRDEIDTGIKYLRKVLSAKNVQRMGADVTDQVTAMLERFSLAKMSVEAAAKRASLAEWIAAQEELGVVPDIDPKLLKETLRKPYQEMTVDEFRSLVDAIQQLEYMGRHQTEVRLAGERALFVETRDDVVESIKEERKNYKDIPKARTSTVANGRRLAGMRTVLAAHLKIAAICRILDGGKDNGKVWSYFVRTANKAGDFETEMVGKSTEVIMKILKPVKALGNMEGDRIHFDGVPSLVEGKMGRSFTRGERFVIALNMGNAGNIQRLLDGEGWTMEQIAPVLAKLTETEWNAVQAIWNHFETLKPLVEAKERRLYGKAPNWIEINPFTVVTADGKTLNLAGGYYPVKYDPEASSVVAKQEAADEAKAQMRGAVAAATTRRSYVKDRAERVIGRPLLLTMTGVYGGLSEVIHDLAWHEWLISANRMVNDPKFAEAVNQARGSEMTKEIKQWIADIAKGQGQADKGAARFATFMRRSISSARLGFNVGSGVMQISGFANTWSRIGGKWTAVGVQTYIANPKKTIADINEKSLFMRNLSRTQYRDLNEIKNTVQDKDGAWSRVHANAYIFCSTMQSLVNYPTWAGAYEKALTSGVDEDTAIALADQAVIDSQGSGQLKDLASVERGGAWSKLFTVFYSYQNTLFNSIATSAMTKSKSRLAADLTLLVVVPAVMKYYLNQLTKPKRDDDDEDAGLVEFVAEESLDRKSVV